MMAHVSSFNKYLVESKYLSRFQLKCFWQFGQEAWMIFGGELIAQLIQWQDSSEAVTHAWNNRHLHLQQVENTGIGLGGLM
jgi:hypothetical protein